MERNADKNIYKDCMLKCMFSGVGLGSRVIAALVSQYCGLTRNMNIECCRLLL